MNVDCQLVEKPKCRCGKDGLCYVYTDVFCGECILKIEKYKKKFIEEALSEAVKNG